ncbi:helix-turn-helix transcriptional regulator [Bhargavaea beijingensis]|uniref:Transcriptional regulator n=1 Tax=Bhargavaea beijingensis TaxID=426756 RepID=A0A1G7E0D6_9BACL|nr:helix-turn-helix transcriptional regulator [Bhargavaea beijingensis]MCW1927456.1 helix-turn-helix transcriptional regulator [Bhargavaea beijingensis]RSK25060.1 transcriptional regulator [Bhargavaea beijingensis]SDE57203.1 putative transcriptional regulator [Bhargavaea beijingensis]
MKNYIRDNRSERGMTQDDLAEVLGVSRQTIISLEKGRYNPSLELAFKLAGVFGCRIEDLFDPEEE